MENWDAMGIGKQAVEGRRFNGLNVYAKLPDLDAFYAAYREYSLINM